MENDLQIKPRYKSSCTPHRVCLCVCCAVHMQKMSITVSRLQRIVNEANERYCQQHEFVISPFAQSASRLCNARMHLNPKSQHVVVILLPEQPPILRAFRILLLPARCRWWCRIRWFAVRIFTIFSATTHVRRVCSCRPHFCKYMNERWIMMMLMMLIMDIIDLDTIYFILLACLSVCLSIAVSICVWVRARVFDGIAGGIKTLCIFICEFKFISGIDESHHRGTDVCVCVVQDGMIGYESR